MKEVISYTDGDGDPWELELYNGVGMPDGTDVMGTKANGNPQVTFAGAPLEAGGAIARRVRPQHDGTIATAVLTPDEVELVLGGSVRAQSRRAKGSDGKKGKRL